MTRFRSALPVLALSAVALALLAGCSAPDPAPSPAPADDAPITVVEHAAGGQDAPVDVEVAGEEGVAVTFRELTLEPGSSTGVHCHHGQLIAVVQQGELTHYADVYEGGVHVYEEGDSVIEGSGYRHEGRNEGDEDLVLWVTYVTPEGMPLAETDLSQCDPA